MLKINKNSINRKRVGRGTASGSGKTSGRGMKGQNSRSGHKRHPGFTTGATPLHMKLPKLEGNNPVKRYISVSTTTIEKNFTEKEKISKVSLLEKGIISNKDSKQIIKIVMGAKQGFSYLLDSDIKHSKSIKTA